MILSERSQTQKNTEFGLTHRSLKESDPQRQGEDGGARGWGRRWGVSASRGRVLVGVAANDMNMLSAPKLYT